MPHCFSCFLVPADFKSRLHPLLFKVGTREIMNSVVFLYKSPLSDSSFHPHPSFCILIKLDSSSVICIIYLCFFDVHQNLLDTKKKKTLLYTLHQFLIKFISWHLTYRAGRNHKRPTCKHPKRG